mmetsp:Transcript_36345/g.86020  ORF Transcript_36345/g.86020 Transcript_36345/m.86020 type:complete len:245 (-) Transcript_36345:3013-3747(-)
MDSRLFIEASSVARSGYEVTSRPKRSWALVSSSFCSMISAIFSLYTASLSTPSSSEASPSWISAASGPACLKEASACTVTWCRSATCCCVTSRNFFLIDPSLKSTSLASSMRFCHSGRSFSASSRVVSSEGDSNILSVRNCSSTTVKRSSIVGVDSRISPMRRIVAFSASRSSGSWKSFSLRSWIESLSAITWVLALSCMVLPMTCIQESTSRFRSWISGWHDTWMKSMSVIGRSFLTCAFIFL